MTQITLTVSLAQTNCYIIFDDVQRRAVVIDPGGDADKIKAILDQNNATLDKILLTHGHWDHIWAVDTLMTDGVDLIMHPDDLPYLTHELNKPSSRPEYPIQSQKSVPTRLVRGGDVISCGGFDMHVMHTPGHTPGSVSYLTKDAMFTGDFLFAGSVGRYDFPGGNKDQLYASLVKLTEVAGDYAVYPGHMESTSLSRELAHNPHIKKAIEV